MFGDPVRNDKTWPIFSINDLCAQVIDCPHSTPNYSNLDTKLYCVRSADIQNGYLKLDTTLQVDTSTFNQRNVRHVPAFNNIVFTREGGRLGNSARIPRDVNICLGQRIMLFIVDKIKATSEFLWASLNSSSVQQSISNLIGGGAAPHVNIKDLKKLKYICPPLALQNRFSDIVTKIESLKSKYCQSLTELENLYCSLSQRAFKGELDLSKIPLELSA
jgi:type I restriction enzyme S subunit